MRERIEKADRQLQEAQDRQTRAEKERDDVLAQLKLQGTEAAGALVLLYGHFHATAQSHG